MYSRATAAPLAQFARWASSASSMRMLPRVFADDLRRSIAAGRKAGAVFAAKGGPDSVFRAAVAEAITSLAPRHRLMIDFLAKGPWYAPGEIPPEKKAAFITDEECARAVRFVFGGVVNAFKGRLGELFAIGPSVDLVADLQAKGLLPTGAHLHAGDVVRVRGVSRDALRKGADVHVVSVSEGTPTVHGVVEVKSYSASADRVLAQLERHVGRLRRGFVVKGAAGRSAVDQSPVLVWVVPSSWKLSRRFEFQPAEEGGSTLVVDESLPVVDVEVAREAERVWRIKLGWSAEALAAAAYELSFWYMKKLGEYIFSQSPSPWPEMTPAEAGQNAAKQSLYYGILRLKHTKDEPRAIALYNMYCFGYALGSGFIDQDGRRDVLFPQDLREIAANGITKLGSRLVYVHG